MEDRKRSLAPDADDAAPRPKRQRDENMRMSTENEAAVEVCHPSGLICAIRDCQSSARLTRVRIKAWQKDAILRQMNEYKREKKHFETLCADLSKKMAHHDDHLRTIDAWFSQLLDEVKIIATDALPTPPPSASETGMILENTQIAISVC